MLVDPRTFIYDNYYKMQQYIHQITNFEANAIPSSFSTPPNSPRKTLPSQSPSKVLAPNITPEDIPLRLLMTSHKVEHALRIKQSIMDFTTYTYKTISGYIDHSRDDSLDRALAIAYAKNSIFNARELKDLESNVLSLSQKGSGFADQQIETINKLIYENIKFAKTKANSEFPTLKKINILGWSYSIISLSLVKMKLIEDSNVFLQPFMFVLGFSLLSATYRYVWLRCCHQSNLKNKAEVLRTAAKEVFTMFEIIQKS